MVLAAGCSRSEDLIHEIARQRHPHQHRALRRNFQFISLNF